MADWIEVIGGGPINTNSASYKKYTVSGTLELEWPLEAAGANVLADFVELVSTAPATVTMPPALQGSTGPAAIFANRGSADISIRTNDGTLIVTIPPDAIYFTVLTNNTSVGGEWMAFSFSGSAGGGGGGGSGASASAYASPTVVAIGGTLNQAMPIVTVTTGRDFTVEDRGKLVNWTSGSGTMVLPTGATLTAGWFVYVRNSGSGALTIDPSGSATIDGQASIIINPNESCLIGCTGTDFFTVSRSIVTSGGGGGGGGATSYISIDAAGTGDLTLSAAQQGYDVYRFTGVLTGNRNIIVPAVVDQFTVRNETTGSFALTVKTAAGSGIQVGQNASTVLYCDGTNVKPSTTAGAAFPLAVNQGGTGAVDPSSARTNLGATSIGDAIFTAASTAAARTALGAGNTGSALFTAATPAAAKAALGIGAMGDVLFQAATAVAAKAALALDQVNNTSDLNKPISNAVANALNLRGHIQGNNTWTAANHFNMDGGAFTFSHASAVTINLWDRNWGQRFIHLNDGLMGFLNSAAGWSLHVDDANNGTVYGNWTVGGTCQVNGNLTTPFGSVFSNNFIFYGDGAQDTYMGHGGDGVINFVNNGLHMVQLSTSQLYMVNGNVRTRDGYGLFDRSGDCPLYSDRGASNGPGLIFRRNGSTVGSVTSNTTGVVYNTTSDARLKPQRRDFDPRDWLMETRVVEHNWIMDPDRWSMGVIAQDEIARFPEAVSVGKGEPGEEGFVPWQVGYEKYVAPLMRGWQLDHEELVALREEVKQLRSLILGD